MIIVTVGIGLAKNAFAMHGMDEAGKLVQKRGCSDEISDTHADSQALWRPFW